MKKVLTIVIVAVLFVAAFVGGCAIGSKIAYTDPDISDTDQTSALGNDAPSTKEEPAELIVFFSPHTGSDETGDGSKDKPFETKEKAQEAANALKPGDNEIVIMLEFMMSIDVRTMAGYGVTSTNGPSINMIPFTGSSKGYYFEGDVVGQGCDTQKWGVPGSPAFSARYLLKGKDYRGKECSIFIENNGNSLDKCTPTVYTDSLGLSSWQDAELRAIVTPGGAGVTVDVYTIHR